MGDGSGGLALVKDLYRHYSEGRVDAVIAALDGDFVLTSAGPAERMITSGVWKGREGFVAYLEKLNAHWQVEDHTPLEFIHQGDRVVVRTRVVVRNRETGRRAAMEKADFWTVTDGRVVSYQEIFDTATVLDAAGP